MDSHLATGSWQRLSEVSPASSFYPSPALFDDEFKIFLSHLEGSLKRYNGAGVNLIVECDFNARSMTWGDRFLNPWGDALVDYMHSLGLVVMNSGRELMFFCRREGSRVDVSFASESAVRKIRGWTECMDVENMSDHHHL